MAFSYRARRALAATIASAPVLVVVAACGARGPLDTIVIEKVYVEADVVDTSIHEASVDVTEAASDVVDAADAAEEVEAAPFDGGALVNCGMCVGQNCGTTIVTCVTDPACTTALQCAAQMCLTGGTPNLQCFGSCTDGSAATQMEVLSVIGCVIGNCPDCTGLLGGLTGGGPGGGG
jgi:hypothetical protein